MVRNGISRRGSERLQLIVAHKAGGADEACRVFDPEIAGDTDGKRADIFDSSGKVHESQLHGTEDKVFISGADSTSKTEEGFVVKYAVVIAGDHCHFPKRKWSKPETQHLPRRESDGLTLNMEAFCTPEAIGAEVLQPEFVVNIQWHRCPLSKDARVVYKERLSEQEFPARYQPAQ